MMGWMDSSCLVAGERNRKGGVAVLELRCPNRNPLFEETLPTEYRSNSNMRLLLIPPASLQH